MSTNKFLDLEGLQHFAQGVKNRFAEKAGTLAQVTKSGDTITTSDVNGDEVNVLELKYASQMDDSLTIPTTIGGLRAGTTAGELKTKTYGEVIDMIAFPEMQPQITAPSAAISFKNGFTANTVYEVGAPAPTATNFNTSFSQGSATLRPNEGKHRAGAATDNGTISCYGMGTLPTAISFNEYKYRVTYNHAAGDELKTSYGNKASVNPNPLPAGQVSSGYISIFGSYHFYTNGVAATDAQVSSFPSAPANTTLPLKNFNTTSFVVAFASEAATNTHATFDIPASKKVTKVECFNPVSGKWDITLSAAEYEEVDIPAKTVQGQSVAYKRIQTKGDLAGERQLRFTVANR